MRCAKVVAVSLTAMVLTWSMAVEAHRGAMEIQQREMPRGNYPTIMAADTIWHTGFEKDDPLGENYDYSGSSPDEWHRTTRMRYEGTSTWITAPQDSYFCHIGNDTTGYLDGNEVGYQIVVDLSNYSDVQLYYLSAMQAYSHPTIDSLFDRFVVWGWYPDLGESWYNLDPGEGYAWGGDWGTDWYTPDDIWISLEDLEGHEDVLIEFWFYSNSGNPEGFGVGIDDIIITGTPGTPVNEAQINTSLPQRFALHPPYPNPFNAWSTIRYQVPESEVEIGIYNVRGQLVRTLAQGHLAAGVYSQTWDGRDDAGIEVESGVYFCHLRSGSTFFTRKLVLLR